MRTYANKCNTNAATKRTDHMNAMLIDTNGTTAKTAQGGDMRHTCATSGALDHAAVAELIDSTFATLAAIGQHLGPVDGIAGTPGRALLDTFAGLADLRGTLDRLAVAAGASAERSPYFPLRAMRPTATTRAAARAAQPWPYSTEEHDNLARVHRLPGPITVRSPG